MCSLSKLTEYKQQGVECQLQGVRESECTEVKSGRALLRPSNVICIVRLELSFPKTLEELKQYADILLVHAEDHPGYVITLFVSAYLFKQTFAIPGSFFLVSVPSMFGLFSISLQPLKAIVNCALPLSNVCYKLKISSGI